ncbi:alpha/beta fold hydrolase [Jiella pacifica]|uniref:Alpha/beta fold hydrolase n=1 Tax=Jiella pacifica TaxID=2696469 RepID=A0A6N9SV89_9HYPH|nr:alpha/beta hydrolase [Jiella pacifica]NDW02953.1 alpha/beta fold hydrolase [Jiella pacifica]
MTTTEGEPFFYDHDGLRLAGRLWGEIGEAGDAGAPLPIVCLPGLTRNSRDFTEFAHAIRAQKPAQPLVALDYRGRGLSQYASGPEAYTVPSEATDTLAGLDHLGISRAVFVGTSRGALVIHLIAAMRLSAIAGAVFNDAGPRIETAGLRQIRDTVGVVESFPDWPTAVAAVASSLGPTFPAMGRGDFERMARAGFRERDGTIVGDYDPRLLEPLRAMDLATDLPELWELFDLMKAIPSFVVRGENSALFSAETLSEMTRRHDAIETVTVAGQGHAPFLETAGLPERILGFAQRCR